jgi:hypothetical protein
VIEVRSSKYAVPSSKNQVLRTAYQEPKNSHHPGNVKPLTGSIGIEQSQELASFALPIFCRSCGAQLYQPASLAANVLAVSQAKTFIRPQL